MPMAMLKIMVTENLALKLSFTEILDRGISAQITKRLGDAFTYFPSLFQFFKLC